MSLPPEDDERQVELPELIEPPVDPSDTRPLKPLLTRAAPVKSPQSGSPPAATVLREGAPGAQRQARGLDATGKDASTEQIRLVPTQPPPPTWRAIFLVGHPRTNTVGVDVRQELTIGRGGGEKVIGLDLSAHHAVQQGVSREHAALIPTVDGLLVCDLGSKNGTWVNGDYLEPGRRHQLTPGDQIELGLLRLVVRSVTLINRGPA